ncbi:MAG: hypothetical protein H6660_19385 [Ardenticatenaceae bacterium]|nr:hypothetical protein [Ardenticatenaceae bacterium]
MTQEPVGTIVEQVGTITEPVGMIQKQVGTVAGQVGTIQERITTKYMRSAAKLCPALNPLNLCISENRQRHLFASGSWAWITTLKMIVLQPIIISRRGCFWLNCLN